MTPLSINRRLSFPILALLAALAVGLLFVLPGGFVQAQGAEQSFTYVENGEGPVATFTASDPEDVTPIVWSLLDDAGGPTASADDPQNLGIFTDSNNDGVDDSPDDLLEADIADRMLFEISQSGVLTFESPPNYEMALNADTNTNTYRVVVQASDGGVGSFVNWFKVTVTVTDMEEPGALAEWTVDADGDDTQQTPNQLLQFQPFAILTVGALTDSDGGAGTGGALTNVRYQWYRSPNDSATGGTAIDGADQPMYIVSDTSTSNDVGMYLRVEATYSDRRGPNKTASYVALNPVQAARDDNTVPEFALEEETRGIQENFTGNVGSPLTATDDDGDILTYSKAGNGADNANESITVDRATGQLMVGGGGLNFEAPTGTGTANMYVVTVKATDSKGEDSAFVEVTITVTDVNETPTFTAGTEGMAADYPENTEGEDLNISTYTSTDPEGADVILSLTGDDAAMFELAEDTDEGANATQVLSFKEMPDFEMPGDQNKDNVYEVTVRASDGELTADRMMTIKITDADEEGEVELSSQDAMIGIELTAELTDSDSGAPDPAQFIDQLWTWHRLDMASDAAMRTGANANAIAGANSPAYTPVAADRGMYLKAMVTYTDRTRDEDNEGTNNAATDNGANGMPPFVGFMNTATSGPTTAVRNNPENQRPVFAEGASTVRLVEENTKALTGASGEDADDDEETTDNPADNVGGGPVTATDDDDGDTVTYTLSGADAAMFRVRDNGQIEVSDKAELDHESSDSHTVMITATDSSGASNDSATITVTIHVTDLDERPVISAEAAGAPAPANNAPEFAAGTDTREVAENTVAGENIGAPVTATDADTGDTLAYTLGGADRASFAINPATGQLMTRAALDHERKARYRVTVTATDGAGATDTIAVIVTVTDVDDAPTTNTAPEFPATENGARSVAENTGAGENIGAPVAATDADTGDTLTYTLGGADAASFDIDAATGQLMAKAALDYEATASYTVEVTATDAAGATDTITVTITVTDVDEPVIPGDANNDGMVDKGEVIEAFRAYVADPSDKPGMIAIFRQYVEDSQ